VVRLWRKISGLNIELVEGVRIVQTWRAGNWPAGSHTLVKFELSPKAQAPSLPWTTCRDRRAAAAPRSWLGEDVLGADAQVLFGLESAAGGACATRNYLVAHQREPRYICNQGVAHERAIQRSYSEKSRAFCRPGARLARVERLSEFGEWFRLKLEGPFREGATVRGRLTYPATST